MLRERHICEKTVARVKVDRSAADQRRPFSADDLEAIVAVAGSHHSRDNQWFSVTRFEKPTIRKAIKPIGVFGHRGRFIASTKTAEPR
jgi:hypothetical protein